MAAFIYKYKLLEWLKARQAGAIHPIRQGNWGEMIRVVESGEFDWVGESE